MEFDVCYFFVFLGVLRIFHRQQNLAYPIDILSSLYLLWATFARRFLLHNTQVALWGIDICSAIMSERRLIKDYLMVSLASWIASSILEYTSSVRFIMLFGRLTSGGNLEIRLSRSRKAVLLAALLCTINSLLLTSMLRGAVQQSVKNVSPDFSVYIFSTIALVMRLLRQCMEGFTFIAGIATRDFRWRNSNSEVLFGHIALSSFALLIHSSVITHTFIAQETAIRGVEHYIVLFSLCTDVVFRIIVCLWATSNSTCFVRLVEYLHPRATVYPPIFIPPPHQHLTDSDPHGQCSELAAQHIAYRCSQTLPVIQPFLDDSRLSQPSSCTHSEDSTHSVDELTGAPFALCRLETIARRNRDQSPAIVICPPPQGKLLALQSQKADVVVPPLLSLPPNQCSELVVS